MNDFSWLSLGLMIITFLLLIFFHMSFILSLKFCTFKVSSPSNFFFSSI